MKPYAVFDVETKSAADLNAAGVDAYCEHPSTSLWLFAYCIGDSLVRVWQPGDPDPEDLLAHIDDGHEFVAHNAYFDAVFYTDVLCKRMHPHWPLLRPEQINCTMARANALQLPPSLHECGLTIGLPLQKDLEGRRLMLQMCKPRQTLPTGEIVWWDDPEKILRLADYCRRDVEAERLLHKRLLQLPEAERQLWIADFRINRRGIRFDMPNVIRAKAIVGVEVAAANEKICSITTGIVGRITATQSLVHFISSRGTTCNSVDKEHIEDLLDGDLPGDVRQALELRQVAGKSSVAKLNAIVSAVNSDGRARGMYTFMGASGTGRWAGRRVQPQNLPRVDGYSQAQIEAIIAALQHDYAAALIGVAYGAPLDALSQCIRALIVPAPGHELIGGDYSQIEARVLPWLAGEDWMLDAFRDYDAGRGPDIYKLTYAKAYKIEPETVTPYQRQLGKPMRLSLGYGGGFGAFKGMAKGYKIKVIEKSDDGSVLDRPQVEKIKDAFRESNPATVSFWYDLDDTAKRAITCVERRSYSTANSAISYRRVGSYLFCRLPSGRCLSYVKPRVEWIDKKWSDGSTSRIQQIIYYGQDPLKQRFTDLYAYGGKLSAHVTQATARDILARCLLTLEAQGYPVILHSHDEPVSEVRQGRADAEAFRQIMLEREDWMGDLPIAAGKPWVSSRYAK